MTIDPARTAVLSLDIQAGVVSVYVKDGSMLTKATSVLSGAPQSRINAFAGTDLERIAAPTSGRTCTGR